MLTPTLEKARIRPANPAVARLHSGSDHLRPGIIHRLAAAVALLVLATSTSFSADTQSLIRQLEAVIKREVPQDCSISVQVADLQTGRVLMEKNAHLPLVPASTMKVVTASAALRFMHPDFTFVTEVLAEDVRGWSVGTLYLRGGGDPYLVSEQLFALTKALREKGLKEIRGNIVVDDSLFIPSEPLDENEKLGYRSYHAPYSALSLNFNSVKVTVIPGTGAGKPARILVDPVSEYITAKGSVTTLKGKSPAQVTINKHPAAGDKERITVTGTIGEDAPIKSRYVNVAEPALYTGEVFKELLLREGIKVTGNVLRGKTPPQAEAYLDFSSRPLGVVVYWLDKFSNNFMAEQISLALGAYVHGAPGTREKGLAVIRKHLLSCGVDEGDFQLTEASGLSRNNRISASALVKVLQAAARDFGYNVEFMASLGVAGVDGTLKEKFTDPSLKRRIRGKTGTLRGVNALTGYGVSPDGKLFVFACIVNCLRNGAGFISHADNVVRAIMEMPLGE
jgi:serine-type D-Ala-D-Ala carboxypeptidase/endopeptidase (penicillin-binding protein 4)